MTNRSLLSKIAEFILFKTKPDYMNSQEKVELFLENKSNDTFRSIFKTKEFKDMKVVSIGEKYDNSRIILYVHGGAYVNQLNLQHQIYCYILSKILKIKILLPAYPLAPKHHCTDSYEIITQLYSKLLENYGQITLMGDSAGGSFILGLCQYINEINLKKPDNVIVFSPWLDVSMKKSPDDSHDPILGNIGLKEIGKKWAGNLSTDDYRVSPIYGKNTNMPRTLLFTGTNEIFYRDIVIYYKKLVNNSTDAKLIIGENMFHIYPLFPIPEAISVLKEIKKEMKY